MNEFERKIADAALDPKLKQTANEKEKKIRIRDVVAVFVPDWHKYVRGTVKKKEKDGSYVIWAHDYGVPIVSNASFIEKLPHSFSGANIRTRRIHRGGIENCLPSETKYDLELGTTYKEKLSNWTPAAIKQTQDILNIGVKLEFEHVEDLSPFNKEHLFGRLMMQRQNGQMVNLMKCLLDMNMAVLAEGEFKYELTTIESIKQADWISINGTAMNMKMVVEPLLAVIDETGFTDSEIFDDDVDDDDEAISDVTMNNEMSIEVNNKFFDESASVIGPMMRNNLNANGEINKNIENGSGAIAKPPNKNANGTFEQQSGNSEQNMANGSRDGKQQPRNRTRDSNKHSKQNKKPGNQEHRPPTSGRNNQANNNSRGINQNQNRFDSQPSAIKSEKLVNSLLQQPPYPLNQQRQQSHAQQRLDNRNRYDLPPKDFGCTEFSAMFNKKSTSLGPAQFQHPSGLPPPPPSNNFGPPFLPLRFGPNPHINFHGMFNNMPPPPPGPQPLSAQFGDRPLMLDNTPNDLQSFPRMTINSPNAPNQRRQNNAQRNPRRRSDGRNRQFEGQHQKLNEKSSVNGKLNNLRYREDVESFEASFRKPTTSVQPHQSSASEVSTDKPSEKNTTQITEEGQTNGSKSIGTEVVEK